MERRIAITYSVTAMTTLGIACVAIAAVGGGMFASAAPSLAANGGKQVEFVDEFIVLHSSTTVATNGGTAPGSTEAAMAAAQASGRTPTAAIAAPPVAGEVTVSASPTPPADAAAAQIQVPESPAPAPESPTDPSPSSSPSPAAAPAPASAPAPAPAPASAPAPSALAAPAPAPAPTTTLPKATTTTVAPTSSTLPPGVPKDWPKNKPIPPMPPGCQHPQLEDNGVWNCQ